MASLVAFLLLVCCSLALGKYDPTWESLDARPLPQWYDEAKLGIFIHWGVFSVPSFGTSVNGTAGEWFWWYWQGENYTTHTDFMKQNYPPDFQYADFAPQFTTEFFDAVEWAKLFEASGAKYIVLTSKHHEGYTNWPSAVSWNWNSMDVGPHRDLVGELASAIRMNTSVRFGLYHSLFEWFNPMYQNDRKNFFKTNDFVSKKTMPELYDIVNKYKPEVIWSDGQWEASYKYWNSTEFLAWLYNDSPVKSTVVTNDRWGMLTPCKHGGFFTCNDRYNPGVLQPRKWENAMTIDGLSWGFRRNAKFSDYLSIENLIQTFVTTISCGGNMLMNVGPTKEGTIPALYQERLRQMGEWLGVIGEAVYGSTPWTHQNDTLSKGIWYTAKPGTVYAFFFTWPESGSLTLGSAIPVAETSKVSLLGTSISLPWEPIKSNGITVNLNSIKPTEIPNKWVWVLKLVGFQ
ncbi:alpha-L-fucosidase-like [Styela clava]|uniref:alpha-L-fucosidase-like n=1 Tax=Styela clava TaxID=7725 RepID=UPI001939BAB5|nr:alpha-L-fucosidase-like [Styela clava]